MVDAVLAQYKSPLFHDGVPMAFPPATRVSDSADSPISTAHIQNGIVRIRNEVQESTACKIDLNLFPKEIDG